MIDQRYRLTLVCKRTWEKNEIMGNILSCWLAMDRCPGVFVVSNRASCGTSCHSKPEEIEKKTGSRLSPCSYTNGVHACNEYNLFSRASSRRYFLPRRYRYTARIIARGMKSRVTCRAAYGRNFNFSLFFSTYHPWIFITSRYTVIYIISI